MSQNLFDRPVRHIAVGLLAASSGLAHHHPVRRPVTGPPESLRVHERLQKVDRMPVHPLPVRADLRRHAAENVRSQMLHPDPGGIQHIMPIVSRPSRFTTVGTHCSASPCTFNSTRKGPMPNV